MAGKTQIKFNLTMVPFFVNENKLFRIFLSLSLFLPQVVLCRFALRWDTMGDSTEEF